MICGDHLCPEAGDNLHYVLDGRGVIWVVQANGTTAVTVGGDGIAYEQNINRLALVHGPLWTIAPTKKDLIRIDPMQSAMKKKPRRGY
jgi:hypothetical protein